MQLDICITIEMYVKILIFKSTIKLPLYYWWALVRNIKAYKSTIPSLSISMKRFQCQSCLDKIEIILNIKYSILKSSVAKNISPSTLSENPPLIWTVIENKIAYDIIKAHH